MTELELKIRQLAATKDISTILFEMGTDGGWIEAATAGVWHGEPTENLKQAMVELEIDLMMYKYKAGIGDEIDRLIREKVEEEVRKCHGMH